MTEEPVLTSASAEHAQGHIQLRVFRLKPANFTILSRTLQTIKGV